MQLLHLHTEDIQELVAWLKRAQDRFTSPTIQNEVLEIMALAVLRKLTGRISGRQYAILVDETPDISNIEQLVFCLRYVDDQLDSHENFIGLHSLESTSAKSIVQTIEDLLLKFSLPLDKCRGQCYDGAAAMSGSKSGVATALLSKACPLHALLWACPKSSCAR